MPIEIPNSDYPYDHLPLAAVVEFGMNYDEDHVRNDIERLSHESSNVGQPLIAHLYRLDKGKRISSRTRSKDSMTVYPKSEIKIDLGRTAGVLPVLHQSTQ